MDPAHGRSSAEQLSPADTAKDHAELCFPLAQEAQNAGAGVAQ